MATLLNGTECQNHLDSDGFSTYKCAQCVDEHIEDDTTVIGDAVTLAPSMQVLQTQAGVVAGVVALPVCMQHRRAQCGHKTRLLT